MIGRVGRAGGLVLGALLVAGGCGTTSSSPAVAGASIASAAPSPSGSPRPLTGARLPAGIVPAGLDADRFVFADGQGASVMNLDSGDVTRIPAPLSGRVFRPTGFSGNLVIGEVSGALGPDQGVAQAIGYDLAAESWLDVAATLPAGDVSSATATDGATIAGLDLGPTGGKGPARAYVFDAASGSVTWLPNLADGRVPVPADVGDGYIVGGVDGARHGGGWVWDQTASSYTMLAAAAKSDLADPRAVSGDTVVGTLDGQTTSTDSPFVYDAATKAFTDLRLPGFGGKDVSGHLVLMPEEGGWNGWLRNLDTGAQVAFDKIIVDGSPVAVRPWAVSDGWVIGLTAPPAGSSAAFGSVVAIALGEQP